MARKDTFSSESSYKKYKKREYERYYASTQIYPKRKWTLWEIIFLKEHSNLTTMELSEILHRSVKSIEHKKRRIRERNKV